ncbi:MAG: Eco57I restriction-modification methylase domain-containing protein, partial [Parafannyhessea sp.]|uniref:Eco57I restriction-modification methylase domain-containing protein n=1 Tax=Parafannyhessea sp. TaxID=2847324 RepID=UPI003F0ADC28
DKLHFGDSNPYEDLPQLRIYTYDLGDVFRNEGYVALDDKAFNFAEFFRVGDDGRLAHERDVWSFLNLLCKSDSGSNYPYSRDGYRRLFRHTLWMVPGVRAAKALKELMLAHPVFGSGQFDIVNVAGDGDEESDNALEYVQNAIRGADRAGTYTITLSCGRLTTGVTVREWTAVLMLAGSYSTSATNYLQTIFRVQSPCDMGGKAKERAYVFDFAPDRTLKMVAKAVSVSAKAGRTSRGDREALGAFLNFCPVIGISGSRMERYDTGRLLRQLKRAWAEAVVRNGFEDQNLYNQELLNLSKGDLREFDKLKEIVGATKPSKTPTDIPINDQGLTDEEREQVERAEKKPKRELTAEEKALLEKLRKAKENRKAAISILTGISVRMPLLIYGADVPYEEDIDLKRFVDMVDERSWEEFMPKGVTKRVFRRFVKYYDEDVFVEAGRRIRNVTRHADTLAPTKRVKEIAHLFGYFKNPDKETVLTPWRVVNMHMGGMLGGWDFWDEGHTTELEEPRFVDHGAVTRRVFWGGKAAYQGQATLFGSLGPEPGEQRTLFDEPSTHILEINSKTGLYPLYVTYSMFRASMGDRFVDASPERQREVWNEVVRNRVFVICKTPMAKAITRRTLVGYSENIPVNMRYVEDLDNVMANKRQQFMRKVARGSYWDDQFGGAVEFSAIVGNPPYQKDDGGHNNSAMPVYQEFVETAIDLDPEYVSMITPSRWFSGGKGLDDYRDRMLHDHHLRELVDFPKLYEPFPNVKIRGGISYFLWDRSWDGPCTVQTMEDGKPVGEAIARYLDEYDVLVRRNEALPILEKVRAKSEPTLDARVSSSKPFGLRTYFHGSESPDGLDDPVKLYGSQSVSWIERKDVPNHQDWLDAWKVLVTAVQGTSAAVETKFLSTPIIAGVSTACSETYLVAGLFEHESEALSYVSYLRTRLVRFLISLRKLAQHVTKDTFAFVPDLTYDHEWTDDMLYERYGLNENEIAFVESVVKPMD